MHRRMLACCLRLGLAKQGSACCCVPFLEHGRHGRQLTTHVIKEPSTVACKMVQMVGLGFRSIAMVIRWASWDKS